ncbi:MAG: metallophosphatase family protein [Acidimicrobiia bacterium]|nr:metallophosphatase family protein [Acidimicrobiia bacterium]
MSDPVPRLDPGRLGVMTDVHGNLRALDAVLADGRRRGVGRWLVLGDVVAMGSHPCEVLRRLDEVDVVAAITGNTERYVLTGDRPDPTLEQAAADASELPRLVEVVGSFAWTKGALTSQGLLERLVGFRRRARFVLADGTRLLAVHASLRADDGDGIHPDRSGAEYRRLFPDSGADLVVGGHTHSMTDHQVDRVRYVNPGSVSNPTDAVKDARYLVVDHTPDGHGVEFRSVGYDVGRAAADIDACGIPGAGFLLSRYFAP